MGPGGLTSFAAAASVAGQAEAGEAGAVLGAGASVQAGVGDAATCKAHAAFLTAGTWGEPLLCGQQPHSNHGPDAATEGTKSGAGAVPGALLPALAALGPRDARSSAGLGALASPRGTGT